MRLETRLASRGVSNVAGLFFDLHNHEIRLCFALPTAAHLDGKGNYTVPGGRIRRLGAHRFEPVRTAMYREYGEETGGTEDDILILSGVGAPISHCTGRGEIKLVQGFAGIVAKSCSSPQDADEIKSVDWLTPDTWQRAINTMNQGKQQLVLNIMRGTCQLSRMYPCVKREITRFLAEMDSHTFAR
ncbi:MAG: hypothetical protein AAB618_00175 [Patescibacteria group bacterium]